MSGSFLTPTIDVYVAGTELGIGNVNAGTINIGKAGTTVNFVGSMNVNNALTIPICNANTMNVSEFIITPINDNFHFDNVSVNTLKTNSIESLYDSDVSLYSNSTGIINIGGLIIQQTTS